MSSEKLYSPLKVGAITAANRIFMAPLTRLRSIPYLFVFLTDTSKNPFQKSMHFCLIYDVFLRPAQ